MSAHPSSAHAYARASARGTLFGLLISVSVLAPFAISAAQAVPAHRPTRAAAVSQPSGTSAPDASLAPSPANDQSSPPPPPIADPTPEPSPPEATSTPTATPNANAPPTEPPTPAPPETPGSPPPTAAPTPPPDATSAPDATPSPTPAETPAGSAASSGNVEYLVTFTSAEAFAERAAIFAAVSVTELQQIPALRMASVSAPAASAVVAASVLRLTSGVARVEAEHERTIEADPNDSLYADQWALPRIGWPAVFGAQSPSGSAIVAILDTGVDANHPDLAGQLVEGATFTGDAPADSDPNGHGTQMAGIVAALADNGVGVAGVAFSGVQVMPVTVLGADGTGTDGDIIAGLVWAVDHGADVVLMSFSSTSSSPSLQAALDYAWDNDVVLVAATGNDGSSTVTYPAGDRGVIGVSNTDESDALNTSSNHGTDTFLGAPGTSIVTTTPGGHYASITGTSAAAAMVAGAAGLLRAFDPDASNGQVVYRLAISADDVAPVEDIGNGRLDLYGAVASSATDYVQPAGAGVLGDGGPIVEPYVAAACSWNGGTSSAWETAANWTGCTGVGGLPGAADSVTIGSTTFAPTISASTGTAIVKDLNVAVGVTVTQTGGTLEIWHDWKNLGTFTASAGTVQFRASGGGGPNFSASNQFYDILVDAGVDPAFDNTASSVINISHNFTNNNTALPATTLATFIFNGTGAQSIYSAKTGTAATFGNLTIDKPAGTLTLTSNANVTALLTITTGTFELATFTANRATNGNGLTMAAGTLMRVGGSSGPTGYTTSSLNATSTVEYYGGAQSVTALNYGNLTLNNGNTKTAAAAITVTGTFLIDTSTTFAASTFTHNIGGMLTVNGTYSPSTGTANFNGSSGQAISGSTTPITFNNFTVNKSAGSLTTSNNLSVAGNLTVTAGTLDLGAFTADRTAAGGTLSAAAGATLKVGGTNGFPANYSTVTLNAASTVEYSGTTQTVAAQTYGHLELSGGSTKTPSSGLTVNGDFTIATNTTFAAGSLTHTFAGNFTNNGTFSPGTSTAVFSDTSGGAIGGTTQTTFATISITTGVMTLNTSAAASALTFQNNNVANSLSHADGIDLTVNGNVTINQASGGGVVHAWNVNAGTATVTGNVTFSVTANNAGRVAKLAITTGTVTVQGDVSMTNAFLAANSLIDMSDGAGTLKLGGALTINTLGTLTPGTTSTVSYNGTGAQTVTVASAVTYNTLKIDKSSGTATLGGVPTVTNVTLQQGTFDPNGNNLSIAGTWTGNDGTFSGGSTTVTFTGASATIAGSSTTSFPTVSIAAGAVVAMNNSNSATALSFVASGTAQSLTQASGTTFTVSGAVTMNQPTGSVVSAWNINAATATVNGLITFAGSNTTAARVSKIVITTGTLNANAGITFVASVAAGKVIDMSGGAGTLNLKGALAVPALSSTLTAGTAGSTFVYADTAAQTINYFSAGPYHNLSVSNSNGSGATLSAAITTGNVTGNVRVLTGGKLDSSTFAIAGTASKTLEVQDGATLRLGGTTAFPTGFTTITLGGGSNSSTVDFYGGAQFVAATATLGTNYDNLTLSGAAVTKTLLGDLTADALLTVNSSATFALSNKNATVGSLTSNGTIATGNSAVTNTFTVGSDGTSTTFSGVFSSTNDAADSIVKTGSGTLTLSGTSTFTGTLKSSAGSIRVDGTLAATSTATIDGGRISGTGTVGVVSGTANGGELSPGSPSTSTGILNAGNSTLASASTYVVQLNGTTAGTGHDQLNVTGTVALSSATLSLSLGYAPTIGDSFTIMANDGSDAVTGTFNGQSEGSTIIANGVSLTVSYVGGTGNDVVLTVSTITDTWTGATSSAWSVAGNWQDNRVPSTGHALVFPSGAASFTPNNDLGAGTTFASVTISGSGYTISGNSITLGSGGLTASNSSGSNTVSLAIVLPADRTVTVSNGSATLTLSGAVSGSFALTKAGSGTLALSGSNSYSGTTTISAGTLSIAADNNLGTAPGSPTAGRLTFGSGTLATTATFTLNSNRGIAFSSTGTIDVAASTTLTYGGIAAGANGLTKTGSGTLTLSGANSYSGATTISAGTLSIAADNNLGTAPGSPTAGQLTFGGGSLVTTATFTLAFNRGIAFSSAGTIDVAASTTLTYGGIAAGANGLTKTSAGTLTLSGANTYGGTTTISAGTVLVNGSQAGSAVSLNGGTLGGSGTVGTITSTASGGSVAPGSAGPAILNGGNLNLSAAGTRSVVVELNGLTVGSGYDQVNVTGTVNLTGATLSGTVGFTPVGGNAFTIVSNDGADAVTGTFSGLAEGATVTLSGYSFSVSYVGGTGNDVVLTMGATLYGNVFEDLNYGGGAGRTKAASSGVGRSSARVELYTSAGVYSTFGTTDANGDYSFTGLAAGTYYIRIVNSSVTSSRTGYTSSALALQTYRTDAASGSAVAVTDYVGGTNPALADPGDGSAGATFNTTTFVYTAVLSGTAQSVTKVVASTADISGLDFGFNFDTVVNVNNSGQGSLRQFIANANLLSNAGLAQAGRTAGIDNAIFMISNGTAGSGLRSANNYFSGGVATITPTPELAAITDAVVLDGQTQPGWASTPLIQLTGSSAGVGARGFYITAGSSTVRGFIINSFTGNSSSAAISIATSGSNTIEGNYLGTNAAGTAAAANYQGIYINNTAANVIGGTSATQRNVISGNTWRGIYLDNGASGNTVKGNYVGLDAAGTSAIANNLGISIWSSPSNTIGGTGAGEGNVISGNTQMGIYLVYSGSSSNTIQGNTIGLNAAGSAAVANGGQGIEICCSGDGGANNTIGGTAAGAANVISGNTGKGIRVLGGTGNGILTNAIYGNGSIGIELGTDGVTANNGTKNGALPNSDMDFPVFTSAVLEGTTLTVVGYVGSAPSQSLFASSRVEVFKSDKDASGNGEGRTYLGYLTADASGNLSGSIAGVSGLAVGDSITATASDASNNTSEFSINQVVAATAYVSASNWGTSANASRYLSVAFPAYLPTSATVHGATFSHNYRSYQAVGTTCYYIEVYAGAVLIGTHGSGGAPISCQSGSSYQSDQVSLSEVNTAARANTLSIRLIVWNSSGVRSEHQLAKLTVDYHLD